MATEMTRTDREQTLSRTLPLPPSRGPITASLFAGLVEEAGSPIATDFSFHADDPLADDDLQLALNVCYELHYAELKGVDARWEWAPSQSSRMKWCNRQLVAETRAQAALSSITSSFSL
jgi:hypothetical protein